jgi:hypothetical protein
MNTQEIKIGDIVYVQTALAFCSLSPQVSPIMRPYKVIEKRGDLFIGENSHPDGLGLRFSTFTNELFLNKDGIVSDSPFLSATCQTNTLEEIQTTNLS